MNDEKLTKFDHSLVRLVSLLKLLEKSSGTLHYLANVLNISLRTIQRDVQLLKNAGFPIVMDPYTKELSLVSDYGVPSIEFTQVEILAILVLFEEFGDSIREPVFSAFTTAAFKIASALSPSFLDIVGRIREHVSVNPLHTNEVTDYHEVFQTILDSILSRRTVFVEYRSPSDSAPIKTEIQPFTVLYGRSWYVIGFSSLYQEIRTFKVSRILTIRSTTKTFAMPASFSVDEYLGNAWYIIPSTGHDQEVVVRFSKLVARNVAEIRWHKTQSLRWLNNGEVELRFTVSGLNEIVWWILGYGAEATVIEPQELRDMIAQHAALLTEKYR